MLPNAGLVAVVVLAGCVVGTAAQPAARLAETCGNPFRVGQKTFQRLDARNAYVWVDDIQSNFRGGYAPFQIAVVVGSAYPPFRADTGRLERSAFDKLIGGAYGMTRTNGTVSEAAMKTGAAVSFTSSRQRFVLRVVSVHTSAGGEDAVMLKLCR